MHGEGSGNLRQSHSLADLTSDYPPRRVGNDVRQRSGSSGALLDIPDRNFQFSGQKRFSVPDIANLAKWEIYSGDLDSRLSGSHGNLSGIEARDPRQQYQRKDRGLPVEDLPTGNGRERSGSAVSSTPHQQFPLASAVSSTPHQHVPLASASKNSSAHSSVSSGLESISGRLEEPHYSPERPRASSLHDILSPSRDRAADPHSLDDIRLGGRLEALQKQPSDGVGLQSQPLYTSPSLPELLSGRRNLRKTSGGGRVTRESPPPHTDSDEATSVASDSLPRNRSPLPPGLGRPPLPPPHSNRLHSKKRFSEADILDVRGGREASRDQKREFLHSDLYKRRMTYDDISDLHVRPDLPNRPSGDTDSVNSFQTSSSHGETRGDRVFPPSRKSSLSSVPLPGVAALGDKPLSRTASLRRLAMEAAISHVHDGSAGARSAHDLDSDRSFAVYPEGAGGGGGIPTINVTDIEVPLKSPDNDYPQNDLSPTAFVREPSRPPSPFRQPLSGASSVSNIYKTISEMSAPAKQADSVHDALGYKDVSPLDDTRSTNADSGLDVDETKDDANGTWRPYDAFQVSEREVEDEDKVFHEILKVLRLVLYGLIFCCVLAGTVASRLSLFLLAAGVSQDETTQGVSIVMLLFCICTPIAFNWFFSFAKILFSDKQWPSFLTVLFLLAVELLQTFGVCLLLFKIIPVTDFFRGITVTMATFQVPAMLKLVLVERKFSLHCWDLMKLLAALLAFGTQIAAIVFFLETPFSAEGAKETLPKGQLPSNIPKLSSLTWELPLALVLTSLGWWENYASGEWSLCGKVKLSFKRARKVVQDVRDTANFLVAPFKIGLTVLLAKYLTGATFQLPQRDPKNDQDSVWFHLDHYSLLYLQIFSSILVTYLASLACKLHMQKAAFALPLLLSPPASLALVYCQCRYEFLPSSWHTGVWMCPSLRLDVGAVTAAASGGVMLLLLCAAGLWVSYCLVASHVWFPSSERMAKIEKLFVTPHLNTIFPDYHLTLRRRRNDHELRTTRLERFTYVGDEGPHDPEEGLALDDVTPKVYVCATMWHETQREMTQLLKSLFKLDYVHCASRLAQDKFQIKDPDYYDLEIHIIFDDSFEPDDDTELPVPNIFVKQFIECMEEAARSVIKGPIDIPPPVKTPTPYGGLLVWTMPGMTKMHVHLKNKDLIRHRKRWSQCMYLYYLLGYRLLGGKDDAPSDTQSDGEADHKYVNVRHRGDKGKDGAKAKAKSKVKRRKLAAMPLRSLLGHMPPEKYEKTVQMSENTFIMTLDGDVDFKPDSVRLLLDRMKKNKKVGAVCGRIHPIGSGPMVWYQQFEYAVGHWLQKASEHVFGCVLCCPGCFSLFRGSALMDDNVMKKYTTKPTEAAHFIQFEQGEDRWLCTLLLQQGHRIDYCAGADALTYAPETFNEFFNQRRRWSPSTLANMMDLLSSWRETVRVNDNISRLYILYQFMLMASSILAPSTVILMITGSYHSVLGISMLWSFVLSLAPVLFYLIICLTQKNDVQIKVGAVLTALYTVVMMIATVGTLISVATESFNSPNVVFLCGLFIIFFVASILHPQEFFCLVYGALYFLVVPSTFILLTVYYLCNLNNVSWGTREMPKKLTPQEEEAAKKAEEEKAKKKRSGFSLYGVVTLVHELKDAVKGLWGLRDELQQQVQQTRQASLDVPQHGPVPDVELGLPQHSLAVIPPPPPPPPRSQTSSHPNSEASHWMELNYLGNGIVQPLGQEEKEFWQFLIRKYLHPLDEDKAQKAKIAEDLAIIRNNVVFIYVMMNFLWCVIALQLQAMEGTLKSFYIVQKYEPLSLAFLVVFALVLVLQFLSMLVHRWGTFLHLMASTRIDWCCGQGHSEEEFARYVVAQTKRLQNPEPSPDYDDEEDNDSDDVGFGSEEDGLSLSDFDESLRKHPLPGLGQDSRGASTEQDGGKDGGGGIYESLDHHQQQRRARFADSRGDVYSQRSRQSGLHHHQQQPAQPPYRLNPQLYRSTSTRGQFPMLKNIFEQNLTNLQQRYQSMQQQQQQHHRGGSIMSNHGGAGRLAGRSTLRQPSWPRRYVPWGGDRQGDMRQRFFNHNFQASAPGMQPLGTQQGRERLFRRDAGDIV